VPNYICTTCGVQYAESVLPPEHCLLCEDERQYVGWEGQKWTTLKELQSSHSNRLDVEGPELISLVTEPKFAIGQRALHVRTTEGNVLWDCLSLADDRSIAAIQALGGVSAIAVSHPHYYSSIVEWSRALGNIPVYLHAADGEWVTRPHPGIVFWQGDVHELAPGLTLLRLGGHFPGGTVLHWASGAGGRGALLSCDILQVGQDRRTVSFMYSYPNYIPVNAATVRRIAAALDPYDFEQIYGAWFGQNIMKDAKQAFRYSVERYVAAIRESDQPPRTPTG
jgi:glyoxylase-like metal-dependent hydrolase (beta-lactamase superfamily II)